MTQNLLIECIHFFNKLNIEMEDVTTEIDIVNGNKVVRATYKFEGNNYKTKQLYYKEITGLDDVRNIQSLHKYFGEKVYWLDIQKHQWPKPSGESDLNNLVINDIVSEDDEDFKTLLLLLANNKQTGYIQQITKDGRPAQYYHNLENNNHWHDLILFIKKAIAMAGQDVGKQYFEHLIFNWDKGKRTSLNAGAPYKLVTDLYNNLKQIRAMQTLNEIMSLLKYKKQIILQGPPGTGKTRLAKQIASEIRHQFDLDENEIPNILKVGDVIKSVKGKTEYKVESIQNNKVVLNGTGITDKDISFHTILEFHKQNNWEQSVDNGNKRGAYAIAYFIYQKKQVSEQVKIIQFHPSYSYEDFVRGIIAESKGDKIEYKNVNKILGAFAEIATKNWNDSRKDDIKVAIENKVRDYFEQFADELRVKVENNETIELTPSVKLIDVEENTFRYKGDEGWTRFGNRMYFEDIIQAFLDGNKVRQDVIKNNNLHGLAKQHATYYLKVLNMFQNYLISNNLALDQVTSDKVKLKDYVLIIDEINRGNLSSVLGELIYALEYRGEYVESMYEVNKSNKLMLPPNLFIIGTMNTADRSVGHIDYAIRRRFAFVDIQPKDLTSEEGDKFHRDLFDKVSNLFITNLSPEFEKKDVQLGHSYFIDKSEEGGSIDIRLQYEIKPILNEYVKDAILIGENIKQTIEDLTA
jgi:DNA polymerase III delta prime subunit